MSWRRFQVLLRCLSPNSYAVARIQSDGYIGSGRREAPVVVEGRAVDTWLSSHYG